MPRVWQALQVSQNVTKTVGLKVKGKRFCEYFLEPPLSLYKSDNIYYGI